MNHACCWYILFGWVIMLLIAWREYVVAHDLLNSMHLHGWVMMIYIVAHIWREYIAHLWWGDDEFSAANNVIMSYLMLLLLLLPIDVLLIFLVDDILIWWLMRFVMMRMYMLLPWHIYMMFPSIDFVIDVQVEHGGC